MKASTVLLVAGGAGAAVLLVRALRRQQAPKETGGGACELARDIAEKAQPGSGAAAYLACKALGAVKDAVVIDWEQRDRDNIALNGEIEIPLDAGIAYHTVSPLRGNLPALRGSVVRFKSGCVPYKDAAGFSKCKPGTYSMVLDGGTKTRKLGEPSKLVNTNWSGAFSQLEGDPFTQGPYAAGGKLRVDVETAQGTIHVPIDDKFSLPLSAGEVGWYAGGRAFKCAEGKQPAFGVRDQRTGEPGTPSCDGAQWTGTATQLGGDGGGGTGTSSTLACKGTQPPAGYTWVEATIDKPGHWERVRPGQAPNPGPCGPNYHPPKLSPTLLTQVSAGTLATATKRV